MIQSKVTIKILKIISQYAPVVPEISAFKQTNIIKRTLIERNTIEHEPVATKRKHHNSSYFYIKFVLFVCKINCSKLRVPVS